MLPILHSVNAEEKEQLPLSPVMPKVHPLAENLAKIGAFSCAERANQIANFLAGSNPVELVIQTPKDNTNNRLLMSTILIKANKDSYITASIALAPNQANGCGGSYRATFYSPLACNAATKQAYPDAKFQQLGQSNVQISIINRALWIMAMPADKGCTIIKEELVE